MKNLFKMLFEMRKMPVVGIDLMIRSAEGNDPFYGKITREYYESTQKRHGKIPLIKVDQYGVALIRLPADFDEYFMMIEASARRNYKKAVRAGYSFAKIDYNVFLDDIGGIWQSARTRQGDMPDYIVAGRPRPCSNPPSTTAVHDYPYFGILRDGKLVAYAGCLISGELCAIEQVYGHVDYQADGVTPLLIISMAGYIIKNYPYVKYYTYDTFLGASLNMRRFKRKFGFAPHKVEWELGE